MPKIQKSEEVQDEASAIDSLSDLSTQPLISVSSDSEFPSTKWTQDWDLVTVNGGPETSALWHPIRPLCQVQLNLPAVYRT